MRVGKGGGFKRGALSATPWQALLLLKDICGRRIFVSPEKIHPPHLCSETAVKKGSEVSTA